MKIKKIFYNCLFVVLFIITNSFVIYANHTHTNGCYNDNVHFHEGDEINGGKCYQNAIAHTHNENCYVYDCTQSSNISYSSSIDLIGNISCNNPNCLSNTLETQDIIKKITNTCNGCGASTSKVFCALCEQTISGTEDVTHNQVNYELAKNKPNIYLVCGRTSAEKYTLTCTLEEGKNYGELICGTKITSIVAENPIQSGVLNTNVIVYYEDEHNEIKQATSNYDSNKNYNGELITLSYNNFTVDIVFYSSSSNSDIIMKDETKNDLLISENQNVGTAINDETISNEIINETTQIKDETIEIKDETTDEFLEENGLQEITIKEPIIMDLEEEVTEIKETVDVKTSKNITPIIILVIISSLIIGIIYFINKKKK